MDEMLQEMRSDVKEIKQQVMELVKQGAIHNTILLEHEKRSTQLETRLKPIEEDFVFRQKLFVVLLGGGGILASFTIISQIVKFFIKSSA